jgi:integrase
MAKLSTRQRGKKNPTWYYSFDAGTMPDGKRKRVEKGGFATEKEARNAGTKAMASFLKGNIAIISEKISVRDFLAEWLERKKLEVRPKSFDTYRSIVGKITGVIGKVYVQSLRPRDIDNLMRRFAGEGLSHKTLVMVLAVLKSSLKYAVYPAEIIATNPAQYIDLPKNTPRNIVKREVIRGEKLMEILSAFPFGHPIHMPVMIAYHTGMRIGEVLGLSWDCVDLEKGIASVKRQVFYARETGISFGLPKTASGLRSIPIGGELLALLKRWKAQQAANEMKHGKAYIYAYEDPNGHLWQMQKQVMPEKGMERRFLVCTTENGKAINASTLERAMRMHGTNFHSFRHTHATLCAESGAPAKGLAGRLGHSNTAITENLYTHETERLQESTLNAFEKSIQKSVL